MLAEPLTFHVNTVGYVSEEKTLLKEVWNCISTKIKRKNQTHTSLYSWVKVNRTVLLFIVHGMVRKGKRNVNFSKILKSLSSTVYRLTS